MSGDVLDYAGYEFPAVEHHSGGQQHSLNSAMADGPYDACLHDILDGEDDPVIGTQQDQQQQGKQLFSSLSSMVQGFPSGHEWYL